MGNKMKCLSKPWSLLLFDLISISFTVYHFGIAWPFEDQLSVDCNGALPFSLNTSNKQAI